MSPGVLVLIIPAITGLLLANRLFRLAHPTQWLPVGLTTGLLLNAMIANLFLRAGFSVGGSFVGTVLVLALFGVLAYFLLPRPEPDKIDLHPFCWFYLLVGCVLVHHTVVSILFLNPDDDFWIHAPMQAQLMQGNFPLLNPAFPELTYGGHYARDLFVVCLSWWSGVELYAVQAPAVSFLQVNAFLLVFAAGLRFGRSPHAAVFTSLFVFMGVNAASRGGWLDTVANNNPIAQSHTALLIFLFLKILFETVSWKEVMLTGVLFAGLAWSYETNFVILSLALLFLAAVVALKRRLSVRQLKVTGVVVLVSLAFLGLQGGILGEFLEKLRAPAVVEETETDLVTQAQNLEVSVKFPKDNLFQIKLNRAGDEVSLAFAVFPWARPVRHVSEPGYVSVFSPTVWKIHWLSFYLCPLALVFLWRRFNELGMLFWGFGATAYLIPSVIDFGLWEVEVFRWEYAASCGFAGALGVTLGIFLDGLDRPTWMVQGSRLQVHRRVLVYLGVAGLIYLNCYPSWVQVLQRRSQLPTVRDGFLFPSTERWLAFHPGLALEAEDLRIGRELREMVRQGDILLMNRRSSGPMDLYPESAFLGLTGTLSTGHAFPLHTERVGTMPFRSHAAAIAFMETGDVSLLRNFDLDWLYLRETALQVQTGPSLKEALRGEERVVFRVEQERFPSPRLLDQQHPTVSLSVSEESFNLGNEDYTTLSFTVEGTPKASEQILTYRFYSIEDGEPVVGEEGMSQVLPELQGGVGRMHFVAPHNPGRYLVKFFLGGETAHRIGSMEIETVQLRAFEELEVSWEGTEAEPFQEATVQPVKLRFHNPTTVDLRLSGRYTLGPKLPGTWPADWQPLELEISPGSSKTVSLYTAPAEVTGRVPFELILNPQDGYRAFDLEPREITSTVR